MHTPNSAGRAGPDRVIYYTETDSPLGPLLLTSDGRSLNGLYMTEQTRAMVGEPLMAWGIEGDRQGKGQWVPDGSVEPFTLVKTQLGAYFEGRLTYFELPLAMHGTAFQQEVWMALRRIQFGTTISYGDLARRLGNPGASRAVGLANGQNPIAIIVPCHRVIGSNGKLTGYGGGLPRKAALLDFEFSVRLNGPCSFPQMPSTGPGGLIVSSP